MKKIVSFVLCIIMIFALSTPVFAAAPNGPVARPTYVANPKDGTDVTLRVHTDVVVRSEPTTSSSKLGTLYVGDTVHVIYWQWTDTKVNGYYWAQIDYGDSVGYVANSLLS